MANTPPIFEPWAAGDFVADHLIENGLPVNRHVLRCLAARALALVGALAIALFGGMPNGLAQEGAAALVGHVVRPVHPILMGLHQNLWVQRVGKWIF